MILLITGMAAAGICAVCLLNKENTWNRVGGTAAIILGCLLAVLLYYNATYLPNAGVVLLTIILTSFLLVLVSILVSLLCRGGAARRKEPDSPATEKREKLPREYPRAPTSKVREAAAPPREIRRKGNDAPQSSARAAGIMMKIQEPEAFAAQENPKLPAAEEYGMQEEDAEDRMEPHIQKQADVQQEVSAAAPKQEAADIAPPQEPEVTAAEEKQMAMGELKALVAGKEYGLALQRVFSILNMGHVLLPEEKSRLKVTLKMLKDKVK